jgi:hypothetical protein
MGKSVYIVVDHIEIVLSRFFVAQMGFIPMFRTKGTPFWWLSFEDKGTGFSGSVTVS